MKTACFFAWQICHKMGLVKKNAENDVQ